MAFLLTEPQHLLFEDPTFSRLMGGCTAALSEHGMLLTLVTAGTPADRARAVEYLGGRHVEGVLLAPATPSSRSPRICWRPGYRPWSAAVSPVWRPN